MQCQRDILDAIRRILRSLRESSRAAETELGISGAQLLVLQCLRSGKSLTINELAERTQTHQSSVSVVISKLTKADLVRRRPSAEDGRKVEVALTAAGTRLLTRQSPRLAQDRLFAALSELSPNKQKQLAELLTHVVDAAGFADQPATLFFEEEDKDETP